MMPMVPTIMFRVHILSLTVPSASFFLPPNTMATVLEDERRGERVQKKEDGTTHVGVDKTEVLLDVLLILSETDLEEDKEEREAATGGKTDEASTRSR